MPKPVKRPSRTSKTSSKKPVSTKVNKDLDAPLIDLTKENIASLNKNKKIVDDCSDDEWIDSFMSAEPLENTTKTVSNIATNKKSVISKSPKKKVVEDATNSLDSDCSDDWLKEFTSCEPENKKQKTSNVDTNKEKDETPKKRKITKKAEQSISWTDEEDNSDEDFDGDDSFDEYFPDEKEEDEKEKDKQKTKKKRIDRLDYSMIKDFDGFEVKSDIFCSLCNSYFNTMPGHPQNNEDHIRKIHARPVEDNLYLCNHCDVAVPKTFKAFKMHLFRHRDMATPKVCACGESFINVNKWVSHYRRCHKVEYTPVNSTTKKYKRKKVTYKRLTCEKCGDQLCSNLSLRQHMAAFHDKNGQFCRWCYKIIPYEEWPEHKKMEKIRKNVNVKTDCDICGKTFGSKAYVRIHKKAYHAGLQFDCPFCDEKFRSTTALSQHKTLKHTEKRYKCAYCNYKNVYRFNITRHLIVTKRHKMKKDEIPDDAIIDLTKL